MPSIADDPKSWLVPGTTETPEPPRAEGSADEERERWRAWAASLPPPPTDDMLDYMPYLLDCYGC